LQDRQKAYKTQVSAPLPQKQAPQTEQPIKNVKFREVKKGSYTSGIAATNHSKNHEDCFRRAKSYKRGDFEKAALNYFDL
jgi:hypothetical protein